MPRTAEKVESFRDILPKGTRVYIANIESPIEEMTAKGILVTTEPLTTNERWTAFSPGELKVFAGGAATPH